ncbi:hypothetical protein CHS0354_001172 [Potamilus streckersoni]|uniref:Uncharacterized protein n=1 Tax=Potamilus streckersoni TaxID=2493646 RepID=A0AAE0T664_9BIVA|nr:hypothetical protein CHS0354_001172 [Potamilus streckersoni]
MEDLPEHGNVQNHLFIYAGSFEIQPPNCMELKKSVGLIKIRQLKEYAEVFNKSNSAADDVVLAREETLVVVYNGKSTDTSHRLRYKYFGEKVENTSIFVKLRLLTTTFSATKYHLFHVHYLGHVWHGNSRLDSINRGWKTVQVAFLFVANVAQIAPSSQL